MPIHVCHRWRPMPKPWVRFIERAASAAKTLYIIKIKTRSSCEIEDFTLKFCRVCGFRIRVWGSYRTSRSFWYGYGSVAELPELRDIVAQACRTRRGSGRVQNMLYPYPGYCGTGLAELTEVPGTGMQVLQNFRTFGYCGTDVQNSQKFREGINMLYPYPGSLWHRRIELPEVPGTGMSVLHKLQKFFVR